MKKRLLGILLILAILMTMTVVMSMSVSAEDIDFSSGKEVEATCQHCNATVTWLPLTQEVMDTWGANDKVYDPANGTHYYVCYTADDQTQVTLPGSTGLAINTGDSLCLHLNGKKLYRNGARGFGVSGTLNIMDHTAEDGSIVAYAKTDSTGMVVRLGSSGAKCNLYGGTMEMRTGSSDYAKQGGCVYAGSGTTFTMYGGTLTSGIARTGGNLYVANGATAHLLGGTITGGAASYGDKLGGNIYCAGQLTLGNCDVTDGTADSLGSDMYFNGTGKLTVKSAFAGETYAAFNAAHLPVSLADGYLTDTLDVCEGVFTGKLFLEKDSELYTLYGKENDTKLYVKEREIEDVDFSAGGTVNGWCQHCKTNVDWKPLTDSVTTTWGTNYSTSNGTHYYVAAEKVKISGGILTIAEGEELCLHLNGNTLYRNNIRAFNLNGTMSIMDHKAGEGVLFAYAESTSTGGVIRMAKTSAKLNLYGGTLQMKTGSSLKCVSGGTVYMIEGGSTFNMYGGTLSGGKAKNGGNLYVGKNSNFTMTGGTMTGGEALLDGSSTGYGGNIYSNGSVTLGNGTFSNGEAGVCGSDLYLSSTGTLTVKSNFAGEGKVGFNSAHLGDPVMGSPLTATLDSCEGAFPGKLYLENSSYLPGLYGKADDTKIYVADTALMKKDGTTAWYGSAAEAMAAYDEHTVSLFTGTGELVVDGGAYTVDLAGADLAVSGTGTVTLFDSANKDGKTYGTATVTGVTVANAFETEVDGTKYYMFNEGNTYSFHCISVGLSGCNIRPSSSGIYYTGIWSCDDKMATMLDSFGVAVSLVKTPDKDFETDTSCLYTAFDKTKMETGVPRNGVIIEGILDAAKTAYRNNKNARMPIYAAAYMKMTDGTVIVGDVTGNYSLHSAMAYLDDLIGQNPGTLAEARAQARAFYETWSDDGMGTWTQDLNNTLTRREDGVLNLLMMPNSYAYYYVEELYALLMENLPEGITEVNIYNVYHSGCSAERASNAWKNNERYYTIFKTCADGRIQLTEQYTATIEEALVLEDWDFIHLHGSLISGADYPNVPENGTHLKIAAVAEPLLDRFHYLFPDAQLLWQRTWTSEIGRSDLWTEEYSQGYDIGMQYISDYMCNEWDLNKPYDLVQVNSGAGWREARKLEAGKNLLPFGGLCARLGWEDYALTLGYAEGEKPNSGDGYHDGDIGGAQLINAYTWYETLTGQDCRETKYRPAYTKDGVTYTHPEELIKIFQDAVHGVVSQMPETVQPAK